MNEQQKKIPIWFIVVIVALFAALTVLIVLLITGGSEKEADPTTEPTTTVSEETTEAQEELVATGGYGLNAPTALADYAIQEATPNNADMAAVVAINDANESILTNGDLQIYYWIEFYTFMNNYGTYASMMGLDTTVPLSQQSSLMEGSTWEQYFLEAATKHFEENYALAQAAYANGYVLSEEDEANIADLEDPEGTFAAEAVEYGYDTVEEYLQANFGDGVSIADYQNYLRTYYAAYDYHSSYKTDYEAALTEEMVIAHYDENAEDFSDYPKVNNIAVRHILIQVDGETDENGEYSTEAWAAAESTANDIYADWQSNPTEEYFIELANEKSGDPGSNTNGGLYDDVYPGQMVTEFNDWCFDTARVIGDHAIIKTSYGYHIMFFVGQNENRKWFDTAKEDLVSVELNNMLDTLVEKYPIKVDYTKVRIFDMITANNETATE